MPSNVSTAADRRRLLVAWRSLSESDEAQSDLEDVARSIVDRGGYDVALAACEITRQHLDTEHINNLVNVKELALKNRAHNHKTLRAAEQAQRWLRKLEQLHGQGARRKWYGPIMYTLRAGKGRGGTARVERIVGPIPPAWSRYPWLYRRVANLIEIDPMVMRAKTMRAGLRGNPDKRRNGILERALKAAGITKPERTAIIHAIGWAVR